jgi:protein-S-isoprenylcysteine O-methyltransferase Ste14
VRLLVKNLLFTVLVPGTVAVYVPVFAFSHAAVVLSPVTLAAVPLLLGGASVYFWCIRDFAMIGRGTPAPADPPKHLVVRGLYRYSRNPMYIGVLSIILGWSLLFQSLSLAVYGLAVAACFHLVVVLYEEPHLARVFGSSYERYCAEVGRWLSLRRRTAA